MPKTFRKPLLFFYALILALLQATTAWGQPSKYLFKIASLAPEGSVWARHFNDFTNEVTEKSQGEITFKRYFGGVMGDDRSMYRKMRIGQLQGGGFTMTGISEIVPDFRVLSIPFLFDSYEQVDQVTAGLLPRFKKAFDQKGLVLLAMTEVGFIYTMSNNPMTTINELKAGKTWAPESDQINRTFLEDVGVSPIPLSIPDVLPALQTGLINTVFNSYYGAVVLQWFTKTRYFSDIPFGYAYGGLVFSRKAFGRLPRGYQALMRSAAIKHFSALLTETRNSNQAALGAIQKNGLTRVHVTAETVASLKAQRDKTISNLIGKAFSSEIYAESMALLSKARQSLSVSQP